VGAVGVWRAVQCGWGDERQQEPQGREDASNKKKEKAPKWKSMQCSRKEENSRLENNWNSRGKRSNPFQEGMVIQILPTLTQKTNTTTTKTQNGKKKRFLRRGERGKKKTAIISMSLTDKGKNFLNGSTSNRPTKSHNVLPPPTKKKPGDKGEHPVDLKKKL